METVKHALPLADTGQSVSLPVRMLYKAIVRLETVICYIAFIAGTIALVLDIFGRELLGSGIFGAQRVAVYCMAVAGIMGFSYVVSHGGHLRPTVLDSLVPEKYDAFFARLADAISCLLCLGLAYASWLFVASTYSLGERDMTLPFNIWKVQSVLLVAFGFSALKFFLFCCVPALRPRDGGAAV
ncbi:TRAP transporter small permease [Arvimicrobium flavum]|uniref:TRAP transporter small permease n=1 Tax=Arvimicrobium flavum TaxID=3393320 RepID=UPI00237AA594|nr:TRAP transporter small permease subunit [Mesorhizobium shangrilense]